MKLGGSESEIRIALRREIVASGVPATKVIEELGIRHGQARVDLATFDKGLHGFEIKSYSDSLARLARQSAYYSLVFTEMTIVAAERHIERAQSLVPDWWGIIVANHAAVPTLLWVRHPMKNHQTDPRAIVELLWRDEVLGGLRALGLIGHQERRPKRVLYDLLAYSLSKQALLDFVTAALGMRTNWRLGVPLARYGDLSRPYATS